MLGRVDLSQPVLAQGSRPFWLIEIAPGRITYTDSPEPDGKLTDFYPVSPQVDADHAVFTTQTPQGESVTITLTRGTCAGVEIADPLTAEVKIGTRALTGCARAKPVAGARPEPANDGAGNQSQ
jgi:uncharacterized membrane protein